MGVWSVFMGFVDNKKSTECYLPTNVIQYNTKDAHNDQFVFRYSNVQMFMMIHENRDMKEIIIFTKLEPENVSQFFLKMSELCKTSLCKSHLT